MSSNIVWLENPIVNGDFKCNGILNASQFVNNIMGTTYSQEVVEFMAGGYVPYDSIAGDFPAPRSLQCQTTDRR